MKSKFYVVWQGKVPGIYTNWADCQAQVSGFSAARYKAFATRQEAEAAFAAGPEAYIAPRRPKAGDGVKTTKPGTRGKAKRATQSARLSPRYGSSPPAGGGS